MDAPRPTRVWPALLRDILLTIVAGGVLYVALRYLQHLLSVGYFPWLTVDYFHLLEAGAIILVGYLFARSIGAAILRLMAMEGRRGNTSIVRLVVNLLFAVAILFALFSLGGVSIPNLFFGSALAGIVLGLASQTVLANVFAGLVIVIVGPFRVNERISLVSSTYGAIWPTYPHELMYPTYTGIVQDIGIFYTVLVLDNARTARIPNSTVLTSLVVGQHPGHLRAQRVRMTFPLSVPISTVEAAIPEVARSVAASGPSIPPPRLEVADVSPSTWDGVVVLWTMDGNEEKVRDLVLRAVLPSVAPAVLSKATRPPSGPEADA